MAEQFEMKFVPSGRGKARCKPDPAFPEGITVDAAGAAPSCTIALPYPAPECGYFKVQCQLCPRRVFVTVAGRADDPRTLIMPCRAKAEAN